MTRTPLPRTPALALAVALTAAAPLVAGCGSDDAESPPGPTTCVSDDARAAGEQGGSDTTVVGNDGTAPVGQGGSAGASEGDADSNSATGDAPGPDLGGPTADDGGTTGNADTGSGGSSRTC